MVEADSGPIGGSFSHEFMVLADTGEDLLVSCQGCDYAANLEKAEVPLEPAAPGPPAGEPGAGGHPGGAHALRRWPDF